MKILPEDHAAKDSLLAAFFLNCVLLVFIAVVFLKLPPVVPLFYSRPSGEEQLVPKIGLLIAPLASFSFLLVNFILAKYKFLKWFSKDSKTQKENGLLALRILSFCSLISSLVGCITVLRITLIIS